MRMYYRMILVITLVTSLAMLANPQVAGAGGMERAEYQSDLAELEGYVWNDFDRDGLQDADEFAFSDVTVSLYNSLHELAGATITDENGLYRFSDLTPGDYYIEFLPPPGFFITRQHRGADDTLDSDAHRSTGKTALARLIAGKNSQVWDAGLIPLGNALPRPRGTVKPPPPVIKTCKNGSFSVGGVSGVKVTSLEDGYCLMAFLWNHRFPFGKIPSGAGQFLAPITFLQIFHHGRLVPDLPPEDGKVEICYAVPPGKQVGIYFFDFHHGRSKGQSAWQPLETTATNGMACAPAQTSGAYALIGK